MFSTIKLGNGWRERLALDRSWKAGWDPEQWLTPGRFACLLGLLVLSLYPDVVVGSHSFFYRDFSAFGYPLASYNRERFWEGSVPLWNPLNNCGLPYAAQWNTMVFYPLSLVYLLFPLPWSLNYFCLGHLILAGVAMYLLAHRWCESRLGAGLAGMGYALNGLTLHSLMWPNNIAALAWMPLVVLTMEEAWRGGWRRILTAAGVGAVQMLSGAPEIILFTWGVVGVLWAVRFISGLRDVESGWRGSFRGTGRLAAAGGLLAGLAAVQMLPFLHLMSYSHRSHEFGDSQWAMPGWGWANLLVPLFHCSSSIVGVYSQDDQQWSSSYYVGIGMLALSVLAVWRCRGWRVWTLAGMSGFGLVMALGENSPVYPAVKAVLPALGFARFPVKFVVLVLFAVPLLAAFAVARRDRWGEVMERSRVWLTGWFFVGLIAFLVWFAWAYPFPREEPAVTLKSGLTRVLFLAGMLGTLGGWTALSRRLSLGLTGMALLLLAGMDAATHMPRQNPTVQSWVYDPDLRLVSDRPSERGTRAMISPYCQAFLDYAATQDPVDFYLGHRRALLPNGNMLETVPVVSGFYSLYSREQWEVWSLLYLRGGEPPKPLLDFMSVGRISSDETLFAWDHRPHPMPQITAGQQPVFAEDAEVLFSLAEEDFDPRRKVYLPLEASGQVTAKGNRSARVLSSRILPEELLAEVEAEETSMVTVAQTAYPHWRATVDDRPVKLWRANHSFQALQIPPGRHEVRLVYRDPWFWAGAWISGTTMAGCLVAWFCLGRRTETGV